MKLKFKKIIFSISLLREKPRREIDVGGKCVSIVHPFLEIAVEERDDFVIYYMGIHRVVLSVSVKPNQYKPSWVLIEESLKKCLQFRNYRKKHKNA